MRECRNRNFLEAHRLDVAGIRPQEFEGALGGGSPEDEGHEGGEHRARPAQPAHRREGVQDTLHRYKYLSGVQDALMDSEARLAGALQKMRDTMVENTATAP